MCLFALYIIRRTSSIRFGEDSAVFDLCTVLFPSTEPFFQFHDLIGDHALYFFLNYYPQQICLMTNEHNFIYLHCACDGKKKA